MTANSDASLKNFAFISQLGPDYMANFSPASETNPLKTKLSITWRWIQPGAQFGNQALKFTLFTRFRQPFWLLMRITAVNSFQTPVYGSQFPIPLSYFFRL